MPSIFLSNKFFVHDLELAKLIINDGKSLFLHNHFILHKSVDVSAFTSLLYSSNCLYNAVYCGKQCLHEDSDVFDVTVCK